MSADIICSKKRTVLGEMYVEQNVNDQLTVYLFPFNVLCYDLMKKQIFLFFCNNHKTLSNLEYILNADLNHIRRKVWKLGNITGYHKAVAPVGNMKWILRSHWLPARASWAHLALSRFDIAQEKKKRLEWTNKFEIFLKMLAKEFESGRRQWKQKKGMNEFREFIVLQKP